MNRYFITATHDSANTTLGSVLYPLLAHVSELEQCPAVGGGGGFYWFEMGCEVAEERGFFCYSQAAGFGGGGHYFVEDLDDVIDVALSIDAARDGEADKF